LAEFTVDLAIHLFIAAHFPGEREQVTPVMASEEFSFGGDLIE
jgi:hypothetical protein